MFVVGGMEGAAGAAGAPEYRKSGTVEIRDVCEERREVTLVTGKSKGVLSVLNVVSGEDELEERGKAWFATVDDDDDEDDAEDDKDDDKDDDNDDDCREEG